ncbi:DUF4880 domain-containing protein [Pseudomonas sp. Teo4]|uniref:DUF4880 domain-containing protein n=1 Tax=Pseudomonas sp. Teo4 TaxID=3064528 RepID=UPI002AB821A2|nr:DUF4880 domain-containing protein [Pseudomonas sp. Teo4]MDZ3991234.1 Protein FecR [Pseudomonas sp. Teo4]
MNINAERLPEAIVCMAIEWQMRLREHPHNPALHAQLQAWRQRDARHELAWQRMAQVSGHFQPSQLPDATHTSALLRRAEVDVSRRRMLKLLGVGLAVGGSGLLASKAPPGWHSDVATATGERRPFQLGDTHVLLNTHSAIDVQDGELLLRAGEVLIDGSVWRARCRFALCQGKQARAVLREYDGYSELHVERGEVRVTSPTEQRTVLAGNGLAIDTRGMHPLAAGALDPFAWSRGLLVVNDIRLGDFLAEAARYRSGWLGCDTSVADLRLSGVFQLDEPALMLRNITHLLPVRVVERTRWWVRVVHA